MKVIKLMAAAVLLPFLLTGAEEVSSRFNLLRGPYLGQEPPGSTPRIFAPGLISTGLHTSDISVSRPGDEIYFGVNDISLSAIFETRIENGRWTEPVIASFSGKGFLDSEPHLSPDGRKLFFLSNRPPAGGDGRIGRSGQRIWTSTRTVKGWSEPQPLPEPVAKDGRERFPSVTKDGTLYFTWSRSKGPARIYRSDLAGGRYREPVLVPLDVPENAELFNAFVSPDEDYLITCGLRVEPANLEEDYYVSFRSPDGRWSRLMRLGPEINAPGDRASSAYVSPDGRYLFFGSARMDPDRPAFKSGTTLRNVFISKSTPGFGSSAIYWVSAKVIDALRPREFARARTLPGPPATELDGSRAGR